MTVGFGCEQCLHLIIVDIPADEVVPFHTYLIDKGCEDCGGHKFRRMDDPDEYCHGVDDACVCGAHVSPNFAAHTSFLQYMEEYNGWCDPTEGAVTPDLGNFFRACNPTLPALVHWARWLRIEHACDHSRIVIREDFAEKMLEAMIATKVTTAGDARMMRLAFHEGFGTRDPNQLELF